MSKEFQFTTHPFIGAGANNEAPFLHLDAHSGVEGNRALRDDRDLAALSHHPDGFLLLVHNEHRDLFASQCERQLLQTRRHLSRGSAGCFAVVILLELDGARGSCHRVPCDDDFALWLRVTDGGNEEV